MWGVNQRVWTAGLSGARLGLCCRGKEVLVGVGCEPEGVDCRAIGGAAWPLL